MKVLLFLLLSVSCYAQKTFIENGKLNGILPLDESGNVSYLSIKTVEGVSQAELYKRALGWFAKRYSDEKNTTQVSDATTGQLLGKGVFYARGRVAISNPKFAVYHSLKVDIKDGKYRITLTDFDLDNTSDLLGRTKVDAVMMASKKTYETLYPDINKEALALLSSFEKAMARADDF